jgi:hypothetical protein
MGLGIAGRWARLCAASNGLGKGRAAALAACPQDDILVNNAGGPPAGDFRDWTPTGWTKSIRSADRSSSGSTPNASGSCVATGRRSRPPRCVNRWRPDRAA